MGKLALLLAVFTTSVGLCVSPLSTVSPLNSLPIGSMEANLTYATNQVDQCWMSIHIQTNTPGNGTFWFEGKIWLQLDVVAFRFDKSEELGAVLSREMPLYLQSRLPMMVSQLTNRTDSPLFLTQTFSLNLTAWYFWSSKEVCLMPDLQDPTCYSLPENAGEIIFADRHRYPGGFIIAGVTNVSRVTIDCFDESGGKLFVDSNDTPNGYYGHDLWIRANKNAICFPYKYAEGRPGVVTVYYLNGKVCEKFDLATGQKVIPENIGTSFSCTTNKALLSIAGRPSTPSVVIERSTNLVHWTEWLTVTNYNGLAWIDNIDTSVGNAFFRLKAP